MPSKYTPTLQRVDIFANLSAADLDRIGEALREQRFRPDQVIFRQGDLGDALYVVADGRVKVFVQEGGSEKVLAFYGEGEVLGEMSLLSGEPRSATAMAMGEARLLALPKREFDQYLAVNAAVMRDMMRVIAQRQVESNVRLTRESNAEPQATTRQGKVFTIFGPRGGSGKTMLAVNLGVALAQMRPERVALVDLSLTFAHCALVLNLAPRASLANIRPDHLEQMDRQAMDHYLETHATTLRVLTGSLRPEEGEAVTGDLAHGVIELLRRMYDVVIVDTGSTFSEPAISALELADRIVLVCTPELATLRDIRDCQRIFTDLIHIDRDRITYVMNHVFSFKPVAVDQFAQAMEHEIDFEIPFGNDVPAKAATHGEAFTQTQAGSNVAKAVDRLARSIAEEALPGAGRSAERRGLFGLR